MEKSSITFIREWLNTVGSPILQESALKMLTLQGLEEGPTETSIDFEWKGNAQRKRP